MRVRRATKREFQLNSACVRCATSIHKFAIKYFIQRVFRLILVCCFFLFLFLVSFRWRLFVENSSFVVIIYITALLLNRHFNQVSIKNHVTFTESLIVFGFCSC